MKTRVFFTVILALFILALGGAATSAQLSPVLSIERAMKAGNAQELSGYFGSSIDITINQKQSTYSSTQAQMVLRSFFSKNGVRDFDITHTGNSPTNSIVFCVGNLSTVNGSFKVYMYLKQQAEGAAVLREIRIQK